ncbi:MAG: dihydrofolate reductase [Candidatus Saccharibacteria bacterium]
MIRLIAAIDQKRGIAKAGRQPWHIAPDEEYFRQQTTTRGARLLMGRKTLTVMGRPLPGRTNYVLTHTPRHMAGIIEVVELATLLTKDAPDLWVIGGAEVFNQTISRADELYLTLIESDFGCDQFFPPYAAQFELFRQSSVHNAGGVSYSFAVYRRRRLNV